MKFFLIGRITAISPTEASLSVSSTSDIGGAQIDTQTVYTLPAHSASLAGSNPPFSLRPTPDGYTRMGEFKAKVGDILAIEAIVNQRKIKVLRTISVTDGGAQ